MLSPGKWLVAVDLYGHSSSSLHCLWDRCPQWRQLAFYWGDQRRLCRSREIETCRETRLESSRKSVESLEFGRLRRFGRTSFVLLYFIAVSIFSRVGVVLGMDSHYEPLGCIRELGHSEFSMASPEPCVDDDRSVVARPRWIFLGWFAGDDMEGVVGIHELDGSAFYRVWHA